MALVIVNKAVSYASGFLGCNMIVICSNCLKVPAPGVRGFLYESQLTKKATSFISVQGNFKDANPKSLENFGWWPKNKGLSL